MMEFKCFLCIAILAISLLQNGKEVVCILQAVDVKSCPTQFTFRWQERAVTFCYDRFQMEPSFYHCLHKQTGGYKEICVEAIRIHQGQFPMWSDANKGIYVENCRDGTYQDGQNLLSNRFNECQNKSECQKHGQISSYCPDGGTIADQQCRCDYKNGFIANLFALSNPQNKSCFKPKEQDESCTLFNYCTDQEELNPGYHCVPKCSSECHRPEMKFDCEEIKSASSTSEIPIFVSSSVSTTQRPSTTASQMKPKSDSIVIEKGLFIGVGGGGLVILIVIILFCVKKCYRDDSGCHLNFCSHNNTTHQHGTSQFGNNNVTNINLGTEPTAESDTGENDVETSLINGPCPDSNTSETLTENHPIAPLDSGTTHQHGTSQFGNNNVTNINLGTEPTAESDTGENDVETSLINGPCPDSNTSETLTENHPIAPLDSEPQSVKEARKLHYRIPIILKEYLYLNKDRTESELLHNFKLSAKGLGLPPCIVDDQQSNAADVFNALEENKLISIGNYDKLFDIINDQETVSALRPVVDEIIDWLSIEDSSSQQSDNV